MKFKFSIWHHFTDGIPVYLARHYWWAYLWRPAIWFFDHQPIINAILFGQYQRLLTQTLTCLEDRAPGHVLQLTCVYGSLTPSLVKHIQPEPLYLADVSMDQLKASRNRLSTSEQSRLNLIRMNAEKLSFKSDSFMTVIIFFLMHEMPQQARQKTLNETIRVLASGSRLIITEYAEEPRSHWIYRFWPLRKLILKYEPFLNGFWHEDLTGTLNAQAKLLNKEIKFIEEHKIFNSFYRVLVYEIDSTTMH